MWHGCWADAGPMENFLTSCMPAEFWPDGGRPECDYRDRVRILYFGFCGTGRTDWIVLHELLRFRPGRCLDARRRFPSSGTADQQRRFSDRRRSGACSGANRAIDDIGGQLFRCRGGQDCGAGQLGRLWRWRRFVQRRPKGHQACGADRAGRPVVRKLSGRKPGSFRPVASSCLPTSR